jgi:hypothetical protein
MLGQPLSDGCFEHLDFAFVLDFGFRVSVVAKEGWGFFAETGFAVVGPLCARWHCS